MKLTRRDMAAMGVLAFGTAAISKTATADAGEEAAVTRAIDELRNAQLAQDKAKLEALTAEHLSYGHSSAVVQNKAEYINGVMTRKATVKSIEFPELKVAVAGNAAVARHLFVQEAETDGKPNSVKIGTLEVWHKQDGSWKLLARQGYKLPA